MAFYRRLFVVFALLVLLSGVVGTAQAQATTSVRTTGDAVIRGGPDTESARLGAVVAGTHLDATGRNADGTWIRVAYQGSSGWVARFLVTAAVNLDTLPVVGATPAAPPAGTSNDGEPSTNETEPLTDVEPSQDTAPASGGVTGTNASRLNVRAQPSMNATALGSLPVGSTITLTGRSGSEQSLWVRFNFNGQPAWVAGWLLRINGDVGSLPDLSAAQSRGQAALLLQAGLNAARAPWGEIAEIWRGLDRGETVSCTVNPTLPDTVSLDPSVTAGNQAVVDALNVLNNGINEARRAINEWRSECSIDRTEVPSEVFASGLQATNNAESAFNDAQSRINALN